MNMNQNEIEGAIKAVELQTGHKALFTLQKKSDDMPSIVTLETNNGFLVVDGRELLDVSEVVVCEAIQ